MGIPGVRILTKYWKRYALVLLVAACFVLTVRVGQGWMQDGQDIVIEQRALEQSVDTNAGGGDIPPLDNDNGARPPVRPDNREPDNLSLREMEMRNAKLEAELKYEKLKAKMLNKDLHDAKKSYNQTVKDLKIKVSDPAEGGLSDGEKQYKLQERRRDAIKRVCHQEGKANGLVNTLMGSRHGLSYCLIPGVMETFWLRVMRFVNRDYVIDPATPLDISKKDAHERPFIRAKQLKWSRLSEDDKTKFLQTKIFMSVQNPYMRLYDLYIHTMVLPVLWSTVGIQIEGKRKSNELLVKQGMKRKICGKDVAFEEFVLYTLESSSTPYESYHRLCDPCQLSPTYIVKTETAQADLEKVLSHFNLDYMVKGPNYSNSTIGKYISDLVTDMYPRFMRSKAEHCVTPGEIGKSLWKALKMEGLINEAVMAPLLDDKKTPELVTQMATSLYIGANLNVQSQKARMMIAAYKLLSTRTKDAIKRKYDMDFKLFEYSDLVEDVVKGL